MDSSGLSIDIKLDIRFMSEFLRLNNFQSSLLKPIELIFLQVHDLYMTSLVDP